jgi:hypothetical protein
MQFVRSERSISIKALRYLLIPSALYEIKGVIYKDLPVPLENLTISPANGEESMQVGQIDVSLIVKG